ncbi:MAG TPA: DNA gyrase modulator, partial [Candidatus Acidoferrales bacterium]|nr:DNA gyrase modulator [Candidatus Acidoferrales bacterium]
MEFEQGAARALDTAQKRGAAYADVRHERIREERVEVRNGEVAALSDQRTSGYGIRAFCEGAWGFAASDDASDAGIDRTAARAVAIAHASSAIAKRRFAEAPSERYVDRFATPVERDPRGVSVGERVAYLLDVEKHLHAEPSIRVGRAWIDLWRTEKEFYSTTGSRIEQTIVQSGSGIRTLAVSETDAQDRSFPGDIGFYQTGGWEIVEEARLRENALRIGEEAHQLLSAPQAPAGELDVILG